MKSTGILLKTNDIEVLKLVLRDMPTIYRDKLNWYILYVDGITNGKYKIDEFDQKFNQPKYGAKIPFNQLYEIIINFRDLWDVLICADASTDLTVSKDMDVDVIYQSAEIVIELFDSSRWVIYSRDNGYVTQLKGLLSGFPLEGL